MTAPSDKELRDKIIGIILGDYGLSIDKSRLEELLALFHTVQQQLLNELLEQQSILPVTCQHDSLECHCKRHYVVPVTAIQKYLDKEAE